MNTSSQPKASQREAFTLVETVLAIGIVSTVLIALLGLLPSGLDIMSEAGQRTVGARINQQLTSEIQGTPFDRVDSYNGSTRHFDDMGTEIISAEDAVYTARIEIDIEPQGIPGGEESPHLKGVVIKIANALREPDFADAQAGRAYFRYATTVAKLSEDEQP